MQASSDAIMTVAFMPAGRIIIRIMVLLMSAQLEHMAAQRAMPSISIMLFEHIVQACSHAEAASMRFCIAAMSMVCAIDPAIIIRMSIELSLPYSSTPLRLVCDVRLRAGSRGMPGIAGNLSGG